MGYAIQSILNKEEQSMWNTSLKPITDRLISLNVKSLDDGVYVYNITSISELYNSYDNVFTIFYLNTREKIIYGYINNRKIALFKY